MGTDIIKGISLTIGALIAILSIVMVCVIVKQIVDKVNGKKRKATSVLEARNTYLKKQMFEELAYIQKYKKELEQGKWPAEMDKKFEYADSKSKEFICEITEYGLQFKKQKRFLRLKECFKKKNDNGKPNDDKKDAQKKEDDKQ